MIRHAAATLAFIALIFRHIQQSANSETAENSPPTS